MCVFKILKFSFFYIYNLFLLHTIILYYYENMGCIIFKYYFIGITYYFCVVGSNIKDQTNIYDLFSVVIMPGHLERICSICKIALGV